jgi:hypothetical protein
MTKQGGVEGNGRSGFPSGMTKQMPKRNTEILDFVQNDGSRVVMTDQVAMTAQVGTTALERVVELRGLAAVEA